MATRIERWVLPDRPSDGLPAILANRALVIDHLATNDAVGWRWTLDAEGANHVSDKADVLLQTWVAYIVMRGAVPVAIVLTGELVLEPQPAATVIDIGLNGVHELVACLDPADIPLWTPVEPLDDEDGDWQWVSLASDNHSAGTLMALTVSSPDEALGSFTRAPVAVLLARHSQVGRKAHYTPVRIAVNLTTVRQHDTLNAPRPDPLVLGTLLASHIIPRWLKGRATTTTPMQYDYLPQDGAPSAHLLSAAAALLLGVDAPRLLSPDVVANSIVPTFFATVAPNQHAPTSRVRCWTPTDTLQQQAPALQTLAWPVLQPDTARQSELSLACLKPRASASMAARLLQAFNHLWTAQELCSLTDQISSATGGVFDTCQTTSVDVDTCAQVANTQKAGEAYLASYTATTKTPSDRHVPYVMRYQRRMPVAVLWVDTQAGTDALKPGHHPVINPVVYNWLAREPVSMRRHILTAIVAMLLGLTERALGGRLALPVGRPHSVHPRPGFYRLLMGVDTTATTRLFRIPRVECHHRKKRRGQAGKRAAQLLGALPVSLELRGAHTIPHYARLGVGATIR
jgi:hypothetical protein